MSAKPKEQYSLLCEERIDEMNFLVEAALYGNRTP
jgi:hypothetical protein